MARTIPVVAIALAGLPVRVAAQDAALPSVPQTISLEEAVEIAQRYNPLFRQVANDRPAAAWGVRNAYAAFLPSLTASGGLSYEGSGSQTFLSQEFTQPSSTVGSSYALSLSWQFSGVTLMQPGLTKARLRATDATVSGARTNLRSAVLQRYLAVLQADAQVALAESQLSRNEEFLRLAQARLDVGQATVLDVRQAEVAEGQAEVALLRARHRVNVDKLRLFQEIGVPAPADPAVVELSDSFPVVLPAWELTDLLADAERHNPDVNALRAQESAARWGERAARSNWFPTLTLTAGWSGFTRQFRNTDFLVSRSRLDADANAAACDVQNTLNADANARLGTTLPIFNCNLFQFGPGDEASIRSQNSVFPFDFTKQPFSARMTISLPIFQQLSRPLQVSEAAAQTDDAREALRARELAVRTDVSEAYFGLQTAYETVAIQDRNRTAASEQLRLATERYRVGSGTFFELLDAQLAADRAESDHVAAVYDYHRAIAALETAVGRPLR